MASWRGNDEVLPTDFLELLVKKEELSSDSDISDEEDDQSSTRSYYPPSSPYEHERSRSPLWHQPTEYTPTGAVHEFFDEDGRPLYADMKTEDESDYGLMPDAHDVFGPPEEKYETENKLAESSGSRGKMGIGRGQRARGRPPLRYCPYGGRGLQTEGEESEDEDIDGFYDKNDETSRIFEWSPMESFQGKEECFLQERTGATHKHESAYDAFRSYWDDVLLGYIVAETNQYACSVASVTFQAEWYPTNNHEIMCLFAFWIMLGIIKMPTIISCFSTDPLLKTEVFRRIFVKRRYENLTRALNFMNADTVVSDRLSCLRPIILHLNAKFQSSYILDKDVCIDESLTLWKGSDIKQSIRSNSLKYGLKTFDLCESTTGYLWSFVVDTGNLSSATVIKNLMTPLLNKGHRLFMDNSCNSPHLARFLKRNCTDFVGTLRPSCQDVPALINKAPLKRGQIIARHSGDVIVLSWQDKNRVTMISTCHDASSALPRVSIHLSGPLPFKPQVVLDYKRFMRGVVLKDDMLEPYLMEQKRCTKWYIKLFKRLLNVSILNSRILLQSSSQKPQDHFAFRMQLVDSILTNHLPQCPQNRKVTSSRSRHQELGRLNPGEHWPALLRNMDESEGSSKESRSPRRRCVFCLYLGRKSIRTTFYCETCLVALCIPACFKAYHTHTSPAFLKSKKNAR